MRETVVSITDFHDYCGRETYRFEDGGRVVVDSIDTRSILPEEKHTPEHQTVHDIAARGEGLEGLPEANADRRFLVLQSLVDSGDLFADVDVVGIQLADPAEILHRLAATVLKEKPAGRFLDPQRSSEEKTGRNYLNSERNDPLFMGSGHMLFNTVLPIQD